MVQQEQTTTLRRGQFLWMDPTSQRRYLKSLKQRIADGYYNSDRVFLKVVEEIAPVIEEMVIFK